jgi:hypothetical protein
MIDSIKNNSEKIKEWSKTLIRENTDIIHPGVISKNIKTHISMREELNPPDIFYDSMIRHVNYSIFLPQSYIGLHNHEEASFVINANDEYEYIPWDGIREYKTTHFVLETNSEAYFVFGETLYKWIENKFEVLDALHTLHYAENPGKTPIRFFYIDYYEN